jgi:hypothetical protein
MYISPRQFDRYKAVEARLADEFGNTGAENKGYPYVTTYSDLNLDLPLPVTTHHSFSNRWQSQHGT